MNWLARLTYFDILVLLIFLLFIIRGFWIGFIRQIAFIVALTLGFVIAGHYHESFYQYLQKLINSSPLAFVFSYLILFAVIYSVIALLGLGLKMVMDVILLGWFDRIVGGFAGALKALFISTLLFMALSSLLAGSNNFLRKSFSYPYLSYASEYIVQFIKDNNLRSRFKLKEPAIINPKPSPQKRKQETGNKDFTPQRSGTYL